MTDVHEGWFAQYEADYRARPRRDPQPFGTAPEELSDDDWLNYCETVDAATWFVSSLFAIPLAIGVIAHTVLTRFAGKPPAVENSAPPTGDPSNP
ncbi:hypothetical protein [Nocardia acidivorans]|uniref:hypothetical protein n=1 Tax=Nocardia acidivorans TaxID=404580 RepID=UPI00082E6096|nr:hypothetical protein [Nocardia acidivorans]